MTRPTTFKARLARNTAASVATNVWTIVLALATLPLVLGGLGAHSFGIWVLLQTFSSTTGWLSIPANGLSVATTSEVAAASTKDDRALRNAIGTTYIGFGLSGLVFGATIAATGPTILRVLLDLASSDVAMLQIVCLAFGAQMLAEHLCLALTSSLEGLQDVALARGVDAARKTGVSGSAALVATLGGDLGAVAVGSAAAALVVTLLATGLVALRRRLLPRRPDISGIGSVIRYAGTVSLLQGTGVLHRMMDRTIAGIAFGPRAVAVVEIANQIQLGSTALLSATTYPMLSSGPWLLAKGDDAMLRALLGRLTRYSVTLTLPLVALIVVFAPAFIRLWVGDGFDESIGLTQVAVIYVALAAPLQAGSNLLQGIGRASAVLRAAAIAVAVNLGASVVLVSAIGLVGVFLGTIVGTVVLGPILATAINHNTGADSPAMALDAVGRALPPTLAAAAVGTLVVWLSPDDLITIGVGGPLALAMAGLAGARWSLHPTERTELIRLLRRRPEVETAGTLP